MTINPLSLNLNPYIILQSSFDTHYSQSRNKFKKKKKLSFYYKLNKIVYRTYSRNISRQIQNLENEIKKKKKKSTSFEFTVSQSTTLIISSPNDIIRKNLSFRRDREIRDNFLTRETMRKIRNHRVFPR